MKFRVGTHPNRSGLPGLILCMLICAGLTVSGQVTMEQLNKNRQQLEDEIRYTTRLLDQTKKSRETSLRDLQLLTSRIRKREALINTIRQEIREVDRQIRGNNILIEKRAQELKALKEEYARMIYYAYKINRAQDRLVFIFSAKDFNQAYQRLKYYQQYTTYRRKQAERIREAQISLGRHRKELEDMRAGKLELAQSESREKGKLDQEKNQKNQTVQELSRKEKQLLATLRSKQQALQKLQAEIERIIAEEARARAANAGNREAVADYMRLSSTFAANRGRLPWPTDQGVVTSTFGEHPHPVLKYVKVNNNGIDIMVSQQAPVKAVFDGTVSKVMSIPNLNRVVMLRHGEFLTVYSNLDEVLVSAGQRVATGQVIGRAHFDAEEGKSELNFQVWHAKTILNPQDWLR